MLMFYAHVKAHARPAGVPVTVSGEAFLRVASKIGCK